MAASVIMMKKRALHKYLNAYMLLKSAENLELTGKFLADHELVL